MTLYLLYRVKGKEIHVNGWFLQEAVYIAHKPCHSHHLHKE